jgi:hypothetical protein
MQVSCFYRPGGGPVEANLVPGSPGRIGSCWENHVIPQEFRYQKILAGFETHRKSRPFFRGSGTTIDLGLVKPCVTGFETVGKIIFFRSSGKTIDLASVKS